MGDGDGNPWINTDGDVVHPNAPNGGGGTGSFKRAAPLGTNLDDTSDLPQPSSAVGRNTVPQPTAMSDGASLVNNPEFERLIELMEGDATAADREWKSNLGNVLFNWLEPKALADYKDEGTACQKAWDTFISEWNAIEFGGGDPKK